MTGNSHNPKSLVNAAFEQDIDMMRKLLDSGIDVNEQDDYHSTALHWAANFGNAAMVRVLLEHGADLTLRDDAGEDAWYLAMDNGHTGILEILRQNSEQRP